MISPPAPPGLDSGFWVLIKLSGGLAADFPFFKPSCLCFFKENVLNLEVLLADIKMWQGNLFMYNLFWWIIVCPAKTPFIIALAYNRPYPSSLEPLFQSESNRETRHSYENDFDLPKTETASRTHFHMKGFALRLVSIHRHKRTRKWPIDKHYKT